MKNKTPLQLRQEIVKLRAVLGEIENIKRSVPAHMFSANAALEECIRKATNVLNET